MTTTIHETAVIASGAELGEDVQVGPYCVIGPRVKVGDRTRIGPQVVIDGVTTIGADNVIFGQASLGAAPQDLSYRDEPTCLEIGDRNTIREFVTINRGTVKGGGLTVLGSDALLMACCHVAHDCEVGDRALLANNVLLAGHVSVAEDAIVNGGAAAHQFVSIGRGAYIGGLTRIVHDVPPYLILEGHPARVRKVNVIGLERKGYSREEIQPLREAFREVYRTGEPRARVLERLAPVAERSPLVRELIESLERTGMGAKGRYRESRREEYARIGRERILGGVRA
ncbi:MAG: acyl-ACP--UDP-N-acetylglucosamine O-acyltransferase [Planctomycetota bacterium]